MITGSVAQDAHRILRESFRTGKTKSLEWRKEQLLKLKMSLIEHKDKFVDALQKDLGRPYQEALTIEITSLHRVIVETRNSLETFAQETKENVPLIMRPGTAKTVREPKGIILCIGAYNFPIVTLVEPLIDIIAAGNCAVVKPNELVPATSDVIAEMLSHLDQDCIRVVQGGVSVSTELLALRWDHICFTGSTRVGRIVAKAAAEHLTPVTLELGGKSPVIVDKNIKSSMKVFARRLLLGKCTNAGQICISPDYVLCHIDSLELFKQTLLDTLKSFYGDDSKVSADYGRMVNVEAWDRVMAHVENDAHKGEILCGGRGDRAAKYIEPTIILNPDVQSSVMKDEIFGPLLVIITVKSIEEAVEFVNEREKALVIYLFSENKGVHEYVTQNTASGMLAINDSLMFKAAAPHFGGVGNSGMGRFGGQRGFDEFSHLKAVTYKTTWVDLPIQYPPYDSTNANLVWNLMSGSWKKLFVLKRGKEKLLQKAKL